MYNQLLRKVLGSNTKKLIGSLEDGCVNLTCHVKPEIGERLDNLFLFRYTFYRCGELVVVETGSKNGLNIGVTVVNWSTRHSMYGECMVY